MLTVCCVQVSWVKAKDADSDILTVGKYTFVNDERFSVFLSTDTWTLVIKYVQARDSGVYECQISTEPKMALMFRLNVIGQWNKAKYCNYRIIFNTRSL